MNNTGDISYYEDAISHLYNPTSDNNNNNNKNNTSYYEVCNELKEAVDNNNNNNATNVSCLDNAIDDKFNKAEKEIEEYEVAEGSNLDYSKSVNMVENKKSDHINNSNNTSFLNKSSLSNNPKIIVKEGGRRVQSKIFLSFFK